MFGKCQKILTGNGTFPNKYVDVHVHVWYLQPTRSEEHEVLQTGSIHIAILSSCQFLYNSAF